LIKEHNFFYVTCYVTSNKPTTVNFIIDRKSAYKSCVKLNTNIIVAADENVLPNYIIENNFTKVRDMKGRIGLKKY
jgi:hypothetical protein